MSFQECSASLTSKAIIDLQMGLLYYGKLGNILMCAAKTGQISNTDNFVNKMSVDSSNFTAIDQNSKY